MKVDATQNPGARGTQDIFPGVSQQFFATAVPEADFPPSINAEYGIRALFKYLAHAIHHHVFPPMALFGIRSGSCLSDRPVPVGDRYMH
jgi:hypothetical protein